MFWTNTQTCYARLFCPSVLTVLPFCRGTMRSAECGQQHLSGPGWNPLSTQTSVFHCGNCIDLWLYNYSTYTPSNTHCPSSVSCSISLSLPLTRFLCVALCSQPSFFLLFVFFPLIASFFPLLSPSYSPARIPDPSSYSNAFVPFFFFFFLFRLLIMTLRRSV